MTLHVPLRNWLTGQELVHGWHEGDAMAVHMPTRCCPGKQSFSVIHAVQMRSLVAVGGWVSYCVLLQVETFWQIVSLMAVHADCTNWPA